MRLELSVGGQPSGLRRRRPQSVPTRNVKGAAFGGGLTGLEGICRQGVICPATPVGVSYESPGLRREPLPRVTVVHRISTPTGLRLSVLRRVDRRNACRRRRDSCEGRKPRVAAAPRTLGYLT